MTLEKNTCCRCKRPLDRDEIYCSECAVEVKSKSYNNQIQMILALKGTNDDKRHTSS